MMNRSKIPIQASSTHYDDDVLFGPRVEARKLIEKIRSGNDSESVIHAIGTFMDKSEFKISHLIRKDKRLKAMFDGNNIEFAFPIQRYCWPKLARSICPVLSIAPEGSGKTYAYLLYIVSQLISEVPVKRTDEIIACETGDRFESFNENDLDLLTVHPDYIIICSSQHNVEIVHRIVHQLKEKAYGDRATESRILMLQPIVRTINVHQDDHELALRCKDSRILIGTSEAIAKCLDKDFINFIHCKKVFFDDIDLTLQIHNFTVREIIKIYILQTDQPSQRGNLVAREPCQLYFFARKWTELVKQFISQIFTQRILIFGSIAEASIYANVKFDLETYDSVSSRSNKLIEMLKIINKDPNERTVIICSSNEEAAEVSCLLNRFGVPNQCLDEPKAPGPTIARYKGPKKQVYVISDASVEFEVECSSSRDPVNNMTHIIHLSLPEDILTFDTRFRLMYKNIQDPKKALTSTLFIGKKLDLKYAKQLYDLFSRSTRTQNSTKLALRDLIDFSGGHICWRWATTGLCRLEKLSREDRFGSFCPNLHSLVARSESTRWPTNGQVKITLTHIVSPNEFYFWIESHRDINDRKWRNIERSGSNCMKSMQKQLDKFKDTRPRSVSLEKIIKKRVYGVYFPEQARVDRVILLDEPKHNTQSQTDSSETVLPHVNIDLEYSKQIPAIKLDYGTRVQVFVRNIFELPDILTRVEAQCHRGFNLGIKPTNSEPEWPYKATQQLFESVNVINIDHVTAWIRMYNGNCYWLEGMSIVRRTNNLDQREFLTTDPLKELCLSGLAERTKEEPLCLGPSIMNRTLSKWHSDRLSAHSSYAFLRRDVEVLGLYLLEINNDDFSIAVRQTQFNKQLIDLEHEIGQQFNKNLLAAQEFLKPGVYCIAKISLGSNTAQELEFNRVKIVSSDITEVNMEDPECLDSTNETQYTVECLDHGDQFKVTKKDLFQIPLEFLKRLPFQAVHTKLAKLNPMLLSDKSLRETIRERVLKVTRTPTNIMNEVFARIDDSGGLYMYVPNKDGQVYDALGALVAGINDPNESDALTSIAKPAKTTNEASVENSEALSRRVQMILLSILSDMIKEELTAVAA